MIEKALPVRVVNDNEAPMTAAEQASYTTGIAGYLHGIRPAERQSLPGYDSGILSIFIFVILLVSMNARNARSVMGRMNKELWSVRRRANAFDDHTAGETGVTISFVLLTCVCEGTLIANWLLASGGATALPGWFASMLMPVLVGVAVVFYIVQLVGYNIVGFTFADKIGKHQWVSGFNASQSLLSLLLFVPALAGLFYPSWASVMGIAGGMMYVLARLVFIVKGFRIFYTGVNSLLYFILYLCTLEIAPLVLVMRLCGMKV